jgi:hypothetical protein
VALLVLLTAAGGIADALNGGSNAPTTVVGTNEPSPSESNGTPGAGGFSGEGCTSGPAEANVRVTLYGGETCATWDRTQSSSGTFWRETSFPTSNDLELVCSMEGSGGHTLIEVRDSGEHFYGNRICALLTSEGWHEAEGPGEKLELSRKAHEAKAKANAEAQTARENQQHREAERPGLEAEASELKGEASVAREKQHHEEGLAKHDEAEANRVEAEEPSEGGNGSKNTEAGELRDDAGTHEDQAGSYKDEAEAKESESEAASKKASED